MVLEKIPTFSEVQTWVNNNADVPNADQADNADTLDGKHADAFADTGHNHDGRYARLFDGVQHPVFSSVSNVPTLSTGESVVVDGDGLYIEDGN